MIDNDLSTHFETRLDHFFGQYQAFSFKTDDILIHSGETTPSVFYLKSGIIKQSAVSTEGQEIALTFYKPGAFFPLIWVIKEQPTPYDFRAVTNGHGWKAPGKEVLHFLQQNAAVSYSLVVRLLSGLEGLTRKVEYALQATAKLRIVEALLTLAYRFGKSHDQVIEIEITLTHQQLAEITGLTRETVSRELKILRTQGLVEVKEETYSIPDVGLLEQLMI